MFTEEFGSSQWVGVIRKTPRSLLKYSKVEPGKKQSISNWKSKQNKISTAGREYIERLQHDGIK